MMNVCEKENQKEEKTMMTMTRAEEGMQETKRQRQLERQEVREEQGK